MLSEGGPEKGDYDNRSGDESSEESLTKSLSIVYLIKNMY